MTLAFWTTSSLQMLQLYQPLPQYCPRCNRHSEARVHMYHHHHNSERHSRIHMQLLVLNSYSRTMADQQALHLLVCTMYTAMEQYNSSLHNGQQLKQRKALQIRTKEATSHHMISLWTLPRPSRDHDKHRFRTNLRP